MKKIARGLPKITASFLLAAKNAKEREEKKVKT
jgi:hypothetical protein